MRTVVGKVGQACNVTEVDNLGRTVGGVGVVCHRQTGGDYAWVRP